ncbi:carboxylesterase family protein [Streptomyces sp. NEAU-H22]|uniref:carboxylesterase/lipase family protein n=1 Tax=unclassified Streptomyces TaxID=2593676 RepID=UPI00224D7B4E|nr:MULTISPECIES: carboxylesterase family protein [unclassified Streptomyces]MCX3290409.1 carboxylesterase family protein [Streptomyces sp. NEAU-H22]WMD07155.1 carboxylesterase family protein [Streptomyces sp. FXY-T5]
MAEALLTDTTTGTVRGCALPDGRRLFAGIPFAAPPVGELRFRPPQPPQPWQGVRRADRFAPAPAQGASSLVPGASQKSSFPTFPTAEIRETSEDCLYLNVWTPTTTAEGALRPVIVWIYGGGYDAGSAAPPYSDGAALARQTGAVVVTANYRLGALGFLHLADLGGLWAGSTNLALQDQMAALRWVRDNIASFGGDPGNITVAGQSAGAFSIGALLAAPAATGLFHKAILQSGSTSRIFDRATATTMAEDLITALGLDDPEDLLTVTCRRILDAQSTVVTGDIGQRNLPGGRSWGAVLDGSVLPVAPQQAVAAGAAADIPLLVGATRDEVRVFQMIGGDSFRPEDEAGLHTEMRRAGVTEPEKLLDAYRRRVADSDDLSALRGAFLTDALYRIPAMRLAQAQAGAGGRAYHYLLLDEPCGPAMGAFHGADLLHVFDKLSDVGADTPEHLAARDTLVGAWAAFAATGDPGWPPYDPQAAGNSRAIGGAPSDAGRMLTEPPADDVTVLWPTPPT